MDDITETEVETEVEPTVEKNLTPFDMESWKSQIQTAKEAIQWLEQGLGSFKRVVEDCM